jgi:hypothetical protein
VPLDLGLATLEIICADVHYRNRNRGRQEGGRVVATYYARSHRKGTAKYGELRHAISVMPSLDNSVMPIGMAFEVGWTEERLALFRLIVHKVNVSGRFTLVDDEFHQVE